MMMLSRVELARRWGTSKRTVDRKREMGLLPWLDLSQGRGGRPQVRFRLEDILAFEEKARLCPEPQGGQQGR